MSTFHKNLGERVIQSITKPDLFAGTLTIKVIQGKLYRDTEWGGEMDPYVVIEYNGAKMKTFVHDNGGKNPVWNHTFPAFKVK